MTPVVTLADEMFEAVLDAFPVGASVLGIPGRDDRLPDYTEAAGAALDAKVTGLAARAEAVDPAGIDATDRVTRLVMIQQGQAFHDRTTARLIEFAITDLFTAPVSELLSMLPLVPITSPEAADGYLARLAAFPRAVEQLADRHRAGIAAGRLPVAHLVRSAIAQIDRYVAAGDSDPLRRPDPQDGVPVDAGAFRARRDQLLAEVVRPALRRYGDFLESEILRHGRPAERGGLCYLPGGDDIYALLIRGHTTTTRTAEELHQTGLDVIARLAEEYARIGADAFGISDPAAVMHRLKTDPALRWRDGEELLAAARLAIARAEREAPKWFGRLPSQSCVVEPVPDEDAPGSPGAYYMQPALDGSRPGTYYANTYQAPERERHSSESVAFHEAVPGHHFQLTLAQELTDLPMLRRLAQVTAFDEGWGLYAERLADEMGLYSGPIDRLGMLAADSMRAARLVVDTGIHAKGWSRAQVVEFLSENTPMMPLDIDAETDRYIADPGQALAYMVGRLEIQRIRADAEAAMGARFDIRAFHDLVLGQGPIPLSVLDDLVREWTTAAQPG